MDPFSMVMSFTVAIGGRDGPTTTNFRREGGKISLFPSHFPLRIYTGASRNKYFDLDSTNDSFSGNRFFHPARIPVSNFEFSLLVREVSRVKVTIGSEDPSLCVIS